ncbi:hypothetical protein JCM14469_05170 [Desulfatiferula olefinivorans]
MNQTHWGMKARADEIEQDLKRTYPDRFTVFKKDVIDYAFRHLNIRKVAELGCVWGVDGAYGQYIHDKYSPDEVIMVDAIWNENALSLSGQRENITVIDGLFSDAAMPERVGRVDAVIFFDILLHMVSPNWDEVLRMYSNYTDAFLIVNPQFFDSPITVRLLDLSVEDYFSHVPHPKDHPTYKRVFEDPYQNDHRQNRPLRDCFYIWQWGITNHDLIDKMHQLGFDLLFLQGDTLQYGKSKKFVNYGFIFKRRAC